MPIPSRHTATPPTPRLLPVSVLLVLLLAGCAGDAGSTPDGAQTPPATASPTAGATTGPGGDAGATEEMDRGDVDVSAPALPATGVLGVAEVEGGCTFVEIDGDRYQLMAAPGASVAVDPTNGIVATVDGEVIAEPGDTITVDGSIDTGVVTFCQIGPVLAATSIEPG